MDNGGSTKVDQLTQKLKFKGLNPATDSTRGLCYKTFYGCNSSHIIIS